MYRFCRKKQNYSLLPAKNIRNLQHPDLLPYRFEHVPSKTRNIAFQFVVQWCCKTICTFLLLILPYLQQHLSNKFILIMITDIPFYGDLFNSSWLACQCLQRSTIRRNGSMEWFDRIFVRPWTRHNNISGAAKYEEVCLALWFNWIFKTHMIINHETIRKKLYNAIHRVNVKVFPNSRWKKIAKPGVPKVLSFSVQMEYRLALLLFSLYYQLFCVIGKLVGKVDLAYVADVN